MFTLLRAVTYSVLFIGFLLVFLPGQLLQWAGITRPAQTGIPQLAGAALVVLGAGLALWCIATFVFKGHGTPAPFDPTRRLVVSGPYRFVRNPMYWGAIILLCGTGVRYASLALVCYSLLFWLATHLVVCGYEEPTLRRLFGSEYEAYCRGVRRWWPMRPTNPSGARS